MSRRYSPDPEDVMSALAGRLDALEQTTSRNTVDLTALGRGVADLTGQLRTTLTPGSTPPTAAGGGGQGPEEEDQGQPDWLDPDLDIETARELLRAAAEWARRIGVHHGITLPIGCWPLHPDVVADVLALAAERATAYSSPGPTGVSEWLTRWLPAARERITWALGECLADRGHRHGGRTHDLTGFDPSSAAAWWATDRATPAVDAFHLTPLT